MMEDHKNEIKSKKVLVDIYVLDILKFAIYVLI